MKVTQAVILPNISVCVPLKKRKSYRLGTAGVNDDTIFIKASHTLLKDSLQTLHCQILIICIFRIGSSYAISANTEFNSIYKIISSSYFVYHEQNALECRLVNLLPYFY